MSSVTNWSDPITVTNGEKIEYEIGILTEEDVTAGKTALSSNTTYTIFIRATDVAGNVSTTSKYTTGKTNEGNYIANYNVDLNGDGNYSNDWRMFYIATTDDEINYGIEEGTMYIIAADYMKNSLVKIAETDDDGNTTTWTGAKKSGSYVIYWNSVPSAQYDSLNLNSDYTSTGGFLSLWGLATTSNGYGKKYNSYSNGKCVSTLLNTNNWAHLVDSTCDDGLINEGDTRSNFGEYAIGSPTLEMWVASYNDSRNWTGSETKDYTQLYYNNTNSYGYYIGNTSAPTTTLYSVSSTTRYSSTLYFPHQAQWNSTAGYWLAAPSAYTNGSYSGYYLMYVSYGGSVGYAKNDYTYDSVRPVVSLQSGVQADYDDRTGLWTLE